MTTHILTLEKHFLDAWIAKALGHHIVGMALAYYEPECGNPSICPEQRVSSDHFPRHLNYFYVDNCECSHLQEIHDELTVSMANQDGIMLEEAQYILGHHYHCLKPVPEYHRDTYTGMQLIEEHRIALIPLDSNQKWKATKNDVCVVENTILDAGLKAFLCLTFGESTDELLICL